MSEHKIIQLRPNATFEMRRRDFGNLIERCRSDADHLLASAMVHDEAATEAMKAYSEVLCELALKANALVTVIRKGK